MVPTAGSGYAGEGVPNGWGALLSGICPKNENPATGAGFSRNTGTKRVILKPKEKIKTLTVLPPSPHWGMTFTRVLNPF
jgi:hypothetical protein